VREKEPLHDEVIYFQKSDPESLVEVEVALQYNNSYGETVYTYVNSVNTREGGTHLEGFRSAINPGYQQLCPQKQPLQE